MKTSFSRSVGLSVVLAGSLLTSYVSPLTAQTIAITGGTVYPVSGPKIERGTVLIRDGTIVAVGANVTVPADAERVDATGKWVTPGFIFAGSNAGTGVSGLFQLNEGRKQGEVNASFSPAEGIDANSLTVGQTRTGGVTTTIATPGGQFITGTASAIDLAGVSLDDMLINRSTALVIDMGDGAKSAGGGSRAGGMLRIRQIFNDALEYDRRKAEYNRGATQELSAAARELEALLPALRGRMPVVALANRRMDIENALRIAREYKLKLIVAGAVESWLVARELAAANVPVMIQPNSDIPSFDGLQARLDIATVLREAGVTIIIAQGDAGGDRDLRYVAGNAVRNGISWDDALKSITQSPAVAFGLTDRGTLEAGKVANVVVWTGDPLDFSGAPDKVYIRGKAVSLRTRETELLERYRRLPVEY